jgi:hypothetical protein
VSGSIHRQELSLPFYEEVLEFLSQGPSAQEIIAFRPGPKAQERFDHLLDINRERPLTVKEEEELDHYIRIEQMMSLLKAKAYSGTSGDVY